MAVYQVTKCAKINTSHCVQTQEEIDEILAEVKRIYINILHKKYPGARFKVVDNTKEI